MTQGTYVRLFLFSSPGTIFGLLEWPCQTEPCLNGGTCLHYGSGYLCACADGWAGKNCGENVGMYNYGFKIYSTEDRKRHPGIAKTCY